jgi:hypothetical protein
MTIHGKNTKNGITRRQVYLVGVPHAKGVQDVGHTPIYAVFGLLHNY